MYIPRHLVESAGGGGVGSDMVRTSEGNIAQCTEKGVQEMEDVDGESNNPEIEQGNNAVDEMNMEISSRSHE